MCVCLECIADNERAGTDAATALLVAESTAAEYANAAGKRPRRGTGQTSPAKPAAVIAGKRKGTFCCLFGRISFLPYYF